ncbi:multidrug effflux MFS transporter [Homoserinibacter sp. YIM 151385]|uniref:multidrug effflux MFS transporter n=1 Tax=Homoserinibacter sp. YIM 151385 TaxID=2985506 RepID=UPI0022F04903|nr:multidrug effflux MFS transporter [Homoserinibacter sp. YIM 151385]WBU36899.1 multidrug effflux MFS transporter [Homoserinibacter sp. YIM 151385]
MTTVMHPGDALTRAQRLVYIIVLGALVGLGPFTIDLYLPAFPVIEEQLRTSDTAIQLTLTATTIGFGLGQLLIGPLSDKVGRRWPLIAATAVHILASVGVALAPTVEWITALRVLQGVGAAGGGVVAMAMVRDLFGGQPLVRMLSRLALVTGLAPVLAPVIGSQLLLVVDWRGVFWALAAYGGLVILAALLLIVETLPPARRRDRGHSTAGERYKALFTDRIFIGVAVIGAMQFSALFTYLSASSFLLQDVYGLDAQQYGLVFGLNSLGLVVGNQISARIIRRVGPQWIMPWSLGAILLGSLAIVGSGALWGGGIAGVLIPLFVILTACGFTFPCVQVLALANHGKEAGTAASLLGAVNFGTAGAVSPIVGALGISTLAMGSVMAATIVVAILSLWFLVRPWTVPALEP